MDHLFIKFCFLVTLLAKRQQLHFVFIAWLYKRVKRRCVEKKVIKYINSNLAFI